jgi:hypothetical protein
MNPGKRRRRQKIAADVAKHSDDLAAITKSLVRIPSLNPPAGPVKPWSGPSIKGLNLFPPQALLVLWSSFI